MIRRVKAVLKKQILDTLKNRSVLIQFILFPLLALIFTKTVAGTVDDISSDYFITMFAAMYVGMAPAVATVSIIAEEKEKGTLRALLMANVKAHEYLLGIGLYVVLMCLVGSLVFALGGGYQGTVLLNFLLVMTGGILCSTMLGASLGIVSKNQMSAQSITLPIVMVFSFTPLIALFNEPFYKLTKFLYTQQIHDLINQLKEMPWTAERVAILAANILLLLLLFIRFYKKGILVD